MKRPINPNRRKRLWLWENGVRSCYRCGKPFVYFEQTTLEHIVASAEGGANTLLSGNLTLAHGKCNKNHAAEVSDRLQASALSGDRE